MRRSWPWIALIVAGMVIFVNWRHVERAALAFLPQLDLSRPDALLLDLRLSALAQDRQACREALVKPWIDASPVADVPIRDGCGLVNGVRTRAVGGARLVADKLSCGLSAALAMWIAHEVQPAAERHLRSTVKAVEHMGGYACRNIAGNPALKAFRSEHATANPLDISGFLLADGRRVSIRRHWAGEGPEALFLREIHARACRYFRVAIGPAYNKAHHDHFHLDRGLIPWCQ